MSPPVVVPVMSPLTTIVDPSRRHRERALPSGGARVALDTQHRPGGAVVGHGGDVLVPSGHEAASGHEEDGTVGAETDRCRGIVLVQSTAVQLRPQPFTGESV